MPRMIICYRPPSENFRFDWSYYVDHHLPLAVGTSMRHAEVVGCDVARPVEGLASDFACICTVHFPNEGALGKFIALFTGHPDRDAVIADQVNYTDLEPIFLASETALQSAAMPAVRFQATASDALLARAKAIAASNRGVKLSAQHCYPAFAPRDAATDDCLAWLDFPTWADARGCADVLFSTAEPPNGLFEMVPFDLQRARG